MVTMHLQRVRPLRHAAITLILVGGAAVAASRPARAQEEPGSTHAQEAPPPAPLVYRPFILAEAEEINHMRIVAQMHPPVPVYGLRADSTSADVRGKEFVHISAEIRARAGNPYGFRNGEWMPGLRVQFTLTHEKDGVAVEGELFPMVARDGPRYGINLDMLGEGEYTLVLFLRPPAAKTLTRVTGDLAGVPEWWEPFDLPIRFTYDPDDVFVE